MRVLLSGFQPFAGASSNPSELLVQSAASLGLDAEVSTIVLPVEFGRAAELLLAAVAQALPDLVLAFGQAEGRASISLEEVALNIDDARIPDNAGAFRGGTTIIAGADNCLPTTLPVNELLQELQAGEIPAELSQSAGTFVCNHVFYALQHALRDKPIMSGFIHVPLMSEQSDEFPDLPTMEMWQMQKALKLMINRLALSQR